MLPVVELARAMNQINSADFLRAIFSDRREIVACLGSISKLAKHLNQPVIFTGGIAIDWHLLSKGIHRQKKQFNDIDIVVDDLSGIRDSLSEDFLINHFHPLRGKGRILIQLVDAKYSTRIDIFTPTSATLRERLTDLTIGDLSCKVVSSEDILAKLLAVIYPLTKGECVDPKYLEHFNSLYSIADLKQEREIWLDYRKEDQPLDFDNAREAVYESVEARAELIKKPDYCQGVEFICHWCSESDLFPIADRHEIYSILGYI